MALGRRYLIPTRIAQTAYLNGGLTNYGGWLRTLAWIAWVRLWLISCGSPFDQITTLRVGGSTYTRRRNPRNCSRVAFWYGSYPLTSLTSACTLAQSGTIASPTRTVRPVTEVPWQD